MEKNVLLNGFGFSGYRSFGDELTKIAPLKKINLIIGQNNVGKSNIIKFLNDHYAYFVSKVSNQNYAYEQGKIPFKNIDLHISNIRAEHRIAFPISRNEIDNYINKKIPNNNQYLYTRQHAKKLLTSKPFVDERGDVWFVYKSGSHNGEFTLNISIDAIRPILNDREWQDLRNALPDYIHRGSSNAWFHKY